MTRRLFAAAFTVPVRDSVPGPDARYDEARGLNLDPRGNPLVGGEVGEQPGTLTEVRGESSDRAAQRPMLGTFTKVREGEAPDRRPSLGTETRVAPEGRDPQVTDLRGLLITETAAPGEPRDRAQAPADKVPRHGSITRTRRVAG